MTKLSENLSTIKSATDRIRVATDTQNDSIGDVATAVENLAGGGADLSEYFQSSIGEEQEDIPGYAVMIKKIPANTTVSGTSLRRAFVGFRGTSIPSLNTANVTDMDSTFMNCKSLTTIPQLNTSNVENMNSTFWECNNLTSIPLIDTSSVTVMENMFTSCNSLTTIPLLNTSSVQNMNWMFGNCSSLETLPACDVSSVETMEGIFSGCDNLAIDDILQWCTRAVNCERKDLDYVSATETHGDEEFEESDYYSDFVAAGWTIHEE